FAPELEARSGAAPLHRGSTSSSKSQRERLFTSEFGSAEIRRSREHFLGLGGRRGKHAVIHDAIMSPRQTAFMVTARVSEDDSAGVADGFDPVFRRHHRSHLMVLTAFVAVVWFAEEFRLLTKPAFEMCAGGVSKRPGTLGHVAQIHEDFQDQMVLGIAVPEL